MLCFIIPLRSPQGSSSWELISKLFERCVRSVCAQTSANFRVIVVCHKKPQIEFSHSHITYIEVDFPPPDTDTRKAKNMDKAHKIFMGLNYAAQFKPSHVMLVDADDCVSQKLANFVEHNPQGNGWFINRGFLYKDGSKLVHLRRKNFYQACGTASILRYDLLNIPESIDDLWAEQYCVPIPHTKVVERFAQKGKPIEPLPFAGAIYIRHQENLSKTHPPQQTQRQTQRQAKPLSQKILHRLQNILSRRPLTSSIRNEFGLYDIH